MRISTEVYSENKKALMKEMGWSQAKLAEMIRGEYEEGASAVYGMSIRLNLTKGNFIDSTLIDLWDSVYFYSREIHVVLPEIDRLHIPEEGVNTVILSKLEKDLTIDTVIGGDEFYIHLAHRNVPVIINDYRCDWTLRVTDRNLNQFSYHFKEGLNTRKVYMTTCDYAESGSCTKCGALEYKGTTLYRRGLFKSDCKFERHWGIPIMYLVIALDVAASYINREKRGRKPSTALPQTRKMMVATPDVGAETVRPIPLYAYVKEYRESQPYVYKGGTHKSPVCHDRSSYFRRCKHGNYIRKDGEFIEVPKGVGNFCKVRATVVNPEKDETLADML